MLVLSFYISALHFLHIRIFLPFSILNPTLVVFLHFGQTIATFEIVIGFVIVTISDFCPPCLVEVWVAFTCRLNSFIPGIKTLDRAGNSFSTFPVFPLSFPIKILTVSPFLIFILNNVIGKTRYFCIA